MIARGLKLKVRGNGVCFDVSNCRVLCGRDGNGDAAAEVCVRISIWVINVHVTVAQKREANMVLGI